MHCLAALKAGRRGGASICVSSGAHMRSARAAIPSDDPQGVGLTILRGVCGCSNIEAVLNVLLKVVFVFRALARQGEHPPVKIPVAARSAFFPSGKFVHVSGPRFSPSRYRSFPAFRTAPLLQSRFHCRPTSCRSLTAPCSRFSLLAWTVRSTSTRRHCPASSLRRY